MPTDSPDELVVLRELLNACPEDWAIVEYGDGDSLVIHRDGDNRVCFMATHGGSRTTWERIQNEASLIIEMKAHLPALLDRIEAADKRIAELERALEPFANHPEFHAPDDWAVTQLDVGDGDPQPGVTAGDFRAARAALQQKERDDGPEPGSNEWLKQSPNFHPGDLA